jgi:hypothetical protein
MPRQDLLPHTIPDSTNAALLRMEEGYLETASRGEGALPARGPDAASGLMATFIDDACRRLIRTERRQAHRRLHVAADAARIVFEGTGAEGRRTYRFEQTEFEGPSLASYHGANAMTWMHAFCLGSLLRRRDLLDVLDRYEQPQLLAAPTGAFDLYVLSLVEAFRLFRRDDPHFAALLDDAERLSQPENIRIAPLPIVARFKTLVPLLRAVARRDQSAFDAALLESLKAHKAFFSRGKQKTVAEGVLAYHASGIAALGIDRGLSLGVESGYAPAWLVRNEAP